MKNLLTLTLSVIVFLSMSIQLAVAQDCSDGCHCTPPCQCFGIEDCGCDCLNFKRDAKILHRGEELGASRDTLEKAFGYFHKFSSSSVIRRLVNEFLWGGCLEIIPRPENAWFEEEWKMFGLWDYNCSGALDDCDDWTGDMTKYDCICIPFYDSREVTELCYSPGNHCMTYVEYHKYFDEEFYHKHLIDVGYEFLHPSLIIYHNHTVIINYYIRQRADKEMEYIAVGDGVFKGWMVKMIRPAQVFGKSME